MRISSPALLKSICLSGCTVLAASAFLTAVPALAQTNAFTFNSGYVNNGTRPGWNPTLTPSGSSDETTAYTFPNSGTNAAPTSTISTTSAIYGSTNGIDFTENSNTATSGGTFFRIAQSAFYVPTGSTVQLTSVTFFGYVRNDPLVNGTYVNPFTSGHLAIYNGPPNSGGAVVGGDATYSANYLSSAQFTGVYRIPNGGSPTDMSRPIFALTLTLPSAVTLTSNNEYFFGTSFNVDHTIVGTDGNKLADGFSVLATATDATYGQPNNPPGGFTNGDAEAQNDSSSGFQTSQPVVGNSNILAAFPFLARGIISTAALPEQGTVNLLVAALPLMLGGMYRRRTLLK